MNSLSSLTKRIHVLATKVSTQILSTEDFDVLQKETLTTENSILASSLSYPEPWQASQYLHIQAERVVDLDDELFVVMEEKEAVIPYCQLLQDLNTRLLRTNNFSAYLDAPLSLSFRYTETKTALQRWASIRKYLSEKGVGPELLNLCEKPIRQLSAIHARYCLHDHRYLELYLDELEKVAATPFPSGEENPEPETPLIEVLFQLDMNSSRVFTYMVGKLNTAYEQLTTPEQQLTWLDTQYRYFSQFGLVSALAYRPEGHNLLDELKGWLTDRMESLWIMEVNDKEEEDENSPVSNNQSIKRNMNVTELAVFEKMLYDLGLTTEQNLETLSVKLSKNFSSRDRAQLRAHSILKKFHVREEIVKFTIQGWLRDMGDWLGRNMN